MGVRRKAPHSIIRPRQQLKSSPLVWCKGLGIVALKVKRGFKLGNGVGMKGDVSFSRFLCSMVSSSHGHSHHLL